MLERERLTEGLGWLLGVARRVGSTERDLLEGVALPGEAERERERDAELLRSCLLVEREGVAFLPGSALRVRLAELFLSRLLLERDGAAFLLGVERRLLLALLFLSRLLLEREDRAELLLPEERERLADFDRLRELRLALEDDRDDFFAFLSDRDRDDSFLLRLRCSPASARVGATSPMPKIITSIRIAARFIMTSCDGIISGSYKNRATGYVPLELAKAL